MKIPEGTTDEALRDAYSAADTLASDRFRAYLPGRLLPVLLARFRDDVAEALSVPLPPLPQRPRVRPAKLDELTTGEFTSLSEAVHTLVTRFTACMDDPELPRMLRDLRDGLMIEQADRVNIADELRAKARAS